MKANRPAWFKVFLSSKALVDSVPDETAGRALKAVLSYFDDGSISDLDPLSFAVFSAIKPCVDDAFSDYRERQERGKKGGAPKGNQNARKTSKST